MKSHHFTLECFSRFCFVVKTSADKMILQIFDIFSQDFSLFSTQLTLLILEKHSTVQQFFVASLSSKCQGNHFFPGHTHPFSKARPLFLVSLYRLSYHVYASLLAYVSQKMRHNFGVLSAKPSQARICGSNTHTERGSHSFLPSCAIIILLAK